MAPYTNFVSFCYEFLVAKEMQNAAETCLEKIEWARRANGCTEAKRAKKIYAPSTHRVCASASYGCASIKIHWIGERCENRIVGRKNGSSQ